MFFSTALLAAASAVLAQAATTIPVQVGNGALTFVPSDIKANVGDSIEFSFFPKVGLLSLFHYSKTNPSPEPLCRAIILCRPLPPPPQRFFLNLHLHKLFAIKRNLHNRGQRHETDLDLLCADHEGPLPVRHGRFYQRPCNRQHTCSIHTESFERNELHLAA
jgi:hypothetical protein